jgi:hypothetical protein
VTVHGKLLLRIGELKKDYLTVRNKLENVTFVYHNNDTGIKVTI